MITRVFKVCTFLLLILALGCAVAAIIKLQGMWLAVNGQYYLVRPMARKGILQGVAITKQLFAFMF